MSRFVTLSKGVVKIYGMMGPVRNDMGPWLFLTNKPVGSRFFCFRKMMGSRVFSPGETMGPIHFSGDGTMGCWLFSFDETMGSRLFSVDETMGSRLFSNHETMGSGHFSRRKVAILTDFMMEISNGSCYLHDIFNKSAVRPLVRSQVKFMALFCLGHMVNKS